MAHALWDSPFKATAGGQKEIWTHVGALPWPTVAFGKTLPFSQP